MAENRKTNISELTQKVEDGLSYLAEQKKGEYEGTLGQHVLLNLSKCALEGEARSEIDIIFRLVRTIYSLPSSLKKDIHRLATICRHSKGQKRVEEYIDEATRYSPKHNPENEFEFGDFGKISLKYAREVAQELRVDFDEAKAQEIVKKNYERAEEYILGKIDSTITLVNEIDKYEKSKENVSQKLQKRLNSLRNGIRELGHEGVDTSFLERRLKDFQEKDTNSDIVLQIAKPHRRVVRTVMAAGLIGLLSFGHGYQCNKNRLEKRLHHYEQIFQERNQQDLDAYLNDNLEH